MVKNTVKQTTLKRNIAIFGGSLYRGGAEHVMLYLAEGLKQKGYNTVIITSSKRKNEYLEPDGIKRHVLNTPGLSSHFPTVVRRLRNILRAEKIDILLVITTPLCIYAIPAATGLDIKVVVSERNDPTHFAGKKITKYLSEFFMKRADGYVFQTHDAKNYYKKCLNGKGRIIYNPLFTDKLPEIYTGVREKKIVAVGRFDKQKNHLLLIEAFAECREINKEYKLVIYGEGVLRTEYETLIKKLHLEGKVALPGNVHDVCYRIQDASLFVMPSNFEGMPNALIEAMAIGLPCIATDCPIGGPSELIEDGQNGILIPVNDKKSLIEKIKFVLSSQDQMNTLSVNAVMIREKLSAEKVLTEWADYIERLLSK